jgi:hypothetical protein
MQEVDFERVLVYPSPIKSCLKSWLQKRRMKDYVVALNKLPRKSTSSEPAMFLETPNQLNTAFELE